MFLRSAMNGKEHRQGIEGAPANCGHPTGCDGHSDRELLVQILAELQSLSERISVDASFQKPVLTLEEASRLIGVSRKRLVNILYEEKARLGRLPKFVCDAGGKTRRLVLNAELLEWLKAGQPRRGRPPKDRQRPTA